jgi:hypothetical protein
MYCTMKKYTYLSVKQCWTTIFLGTSTSNSNTGKLIRGTSTSTSTKSKIPLGTSTIIPITSNSVDYIISWTFGTTQP